MEFFKFCMEILQSEAEKFNSVKTSIVSQLTDANADYFNYDIVHNRCAFLYKCGAINLALARDCFSKFLSNDNGIDYLLAKWRNDRCLTFCSLSKGPVLDYIALLLSHEQCRILNSLIGKIKIITKYGAWKNTADIMLEIVNKGYINNIPPLVANIEVIQGNPFDNLTEKIRLPVNDSDVVMMVKSLNLQSGNYDRARISKAIQEFLEALKPGAVLFCIDTKPTIKEIDKILTIFSGKYLLKPSNMNTKFNFKCRGLYQRQFKCLPIVSGCGHFFVWEKSIDVPSDMKYGTDDISKPIEYSINITNKKYDEVSIDDSKLEFSYRGPLNIDSENYDLELSNHLKNNTTLKYSEENSAADGTFDIGNRLLLPDDNSFFQKNNDDSVFNSSMNEPFLSANCSVEENLCFNISSMKSELNSLYSELNSLSKNVYTQAVSKKNFK